MSSTSAIVTILYPAPADFNLDYYINKHFPMAIKRWGHKGLNSYQIIKLEQDAGYSIQSILYWESAEHFKKARDSKEDIDAIFGDVPNFSNVTPTVISGNVVASTL